MQKAETKQTGTEATKARFPRAKKFSRLIKKGRNSTVKFKAFRSTPKFRTLKRSLRTIPRTPRFARKSVRSENTFDRYSILLAPCTSERFYKKMETENTIIFYVSNRANKTQIRKAFQEAFGVRPQRVNTLNTILGRKKAYIKIPKTNEASEIANKIGLI